MLLLDESALALAALGRPFASRAGQRPHISLIAVR